MLALAFKVPALPFALGMYLPQELNTPLLVGGLVAHFVARSAGDDKKLLAAAPYQKVALPEPYQRHIVSWHRKEQPGTIVIDTPNKFLYLIEANGRAMRYGVCVGRPGFAWLGTRTISAKKEWPDWVPLEERVERQPYLPHLMPSGRTMRSARALYLGSTLYRSHGATLSPRQISRVGCRSRTSAAWLPLTMTSAARERVL